MTPGKAKKLFTVNQVEDLKELGISLGEQERLSIFVDDAFDKLTKGDYNYEDFYFFFEKIFIYLSNEDLFSSKRLHKYLADGAFDFSTSCSGCFGYFSPLINFIFGTNLFDGQNTNTSYDRESALKRNAAFNELLVLKAKSHLQNSKNFASLYELVISIFVTFGGEFDYDIFIKSISKCIEHPNRNKITLYVAILTEFHDIPKNERYSYLLEIYFRFLRKLEKLFCEEVKDQL